MPPPRANQQAHGRHNREAAEHIYDNLKSACIKLESSGDYAIAALVSHAMAMVHAQYAVGTDPLDECLTDDR